MGGEELKWRQLAHNQLMRPQGPHFSPHSTAKTNYKSTNLGNLCILGENPSEEIDYDNYYRQFLAGARN